MSVTPFPTKEEMYQTLQKQFYIELPFPMSPSIIQEAVDSFFTFLEEPNTVKTHMDHTIAPLHRRGDLGYRHRDPSGDIYNDSKEFFHFHPILLEKYADFLEKHPVANDFVTKAKPIWDLAYQTVFTALGIFEPDFPGLRAKIFDTNEEHILLRFLKYNWQSSGKYLAKPHFDAGSFSLAIAESCPGLRIGSCPDDLKPVHHKAENAVFMLSSNFQKVMDTDKLSPGWHDVIQTDETLIGKPFARWAVVAFIEADGVEALPRSETHKWYAAS
ncbi:MAG: hypothetical protein K2Q34_07685 [Alphaproteobacteria bacterium]|nr:hypothetical protein [Alphaproteobacteria bacterium]